MEIISTSVPVQGALQSGGKVAVKVAKRPGRKCGLCGRKELANGICSCASEAI